MFSSINTHLRVVCANNETVVATSRDGSGIFRLDLQTGRLKTNHFFRGGRSKILSLIRSVIDTGTSPLAIVDGMIITAEAEAFRLVDGAYVGGVAKDVVDTAMQKQFPSIWLSQKNYLTCRTGRIGFDVENRRDNKHGQWSTKLNLTRDYTTVWDLDLWSALPGIHVEKVENVEFLFFDPYIYYIISPRRQDARTYVVVVDTRNGAILSVTEVGANDNRPLGDEMLWIHCTQMACDGSGLVLAWLNNAKKICIVRLFRLNLDD